MSKRFLILLAVLLLILVEGLHIKLKPRLTHQQLKQLAQVFTPAKLQGKLAPPFEIQEMSGQTFKLADYIGKNVIVLNFFATWCGPCHDEMPELDRYYQAHRQSSFVFLAIDSKETEEKVKSYMQDLHLTFSAAIDSGLVEKLYDVTAFPTTVLIGVDGRVQFYLPGAISNADVAFNQLLAYNQRLAGTPFAITPEKYLKEVKQSVSPAPVSAVALTGRARRIAAQMPCPCGCDKRVRDCECRTARSIKRELARRDFRNQSDAQIMTDLNRKYCMAGM